MLSYARMPRPALDNAMEGNRERCYSLVGFVEAYYMMHRGFFRHEAHGVRGITPALHAEVQIRVCS